MTTKSKVIDRERNVRLIDYGGTVEIVIGGDPALDDYDGVPPDNRTWIGSVRRVHAYEAGWWGYTLETTTTHCPLECADKQQAVCCLLDETAKSIDFYAGKTPRTGDPS